MSEHNYILCIETATTVCSVALVDNGRMLTVKEVNEPNIHASALTVFIDEMLSYAGVSLQELSAVAVSKGPGSYTGLRIGVSVAKGICYALDLPLVAVESLEAMAVGFVKQKDLMGNDVVLCPMIDARRMEVYTTMYGGGLSLLKATHALIVDEHSFEIWTAQGKTVWLFGNGADKFSALFAENDGVEVVEGFQSSASFMTEIAEQKYRQGAFEDVAYFEPFYLKDFVATTPKRLV